MSRKFALLAVVLSAAAVQAALLQEKAVDGIPTRFAKNVLTLVINQADGSFLEFELDKDTPVVIDGQPGEAKDLDTCGRARVELDGKTVKKVTADFPKEGDLRGTLKAIDAEKGTITIFAFWDEQAQDITIKVTDDSKLYVKNKPAKLADIKPGTQGTIRTKLRESVAILRAQ